MADRSSGQGLPDDWSRGSYPARERYHTAETADAQGQGTAGSRPARAADPFAETADAYGPGNAGPSGDATADRYRAGNADPFAARGADPFGSRSADPFGAETADAYGPGTGNAYGPGTGNAYGPGTGNAYGPGTGNAYGAGMADAGPAGSARPDAEPPTAAIRPAGVRGAADSKGFLAALFDFGFTSFVTPRVIKVLYVLILISTAISALVFTITAFKVNAVFGLLTLIIGDPLFIIIVMAIYRIILEFFVVIFRMSEDIKALRERGDLR